MNPLETAWLAQKRWFWVAGTASRQATDHVGALPQGDAASPLGLIATLSEALRRIKQQHAQIPFGPQVHSVYLDDRTCLSSNFSTGLSVAAAWKREVGRVGLAENAGKHDFATMGGVNRLQEALTEARVHGNVQERPKILGSEAQMGRQWTGSSKREERRLQRAKRDSCLPAP